MSLHHPPSMHSLPNPPKPTDLTMAMNMTQAVSHPHQPNLSPTMEMHHPPSMPQMHHHTSMEMQAHVEMLVDMMTLMTRVQPSYITN